MGEPSFLTGEIYRLCSCRRQAAPACRMGREEVSRVPPLGLEIVPGPVSATKQLYDIGSSPLGLSFLVRRWMHLFLS